MIDYADDSHLHSMHNEAGVNIPWQWPQERRNGSETMSGRRARIPQLDLCLAMCTARVGDG